MTSDVTSDLEPAPAGPSVRATARTSPAAARGVETRTGRRAPGGSRHPAGSALLLLAGVDLGAVIAVAAARLPADLAAPAGWALWSGRATGLLAQVLVLGVVALSARLAPLERAVGQDQLLRWHRRVAPAALLCLVAHPLLLAAAYGGSWWPALVALGVSTTDALVGTGLLLLVSLLSVRALRRRLPYEAWHLLHLATYAAVVLVFLHQLGTGSAVLSNTLLRGWWLAQLIVVLAAVAWYRVLTPLRRSLRHQLRVATITREAPDVVTVTVDGRDLDQLGARGGQYLTWRFLDATHWWRAHPFSLSAVPATSSLRFTARQVGDGTRLLPRLRPGTRVLVEGPYGVLTGASRTRERVLLIGAGLGIAPLRALLQDLPTDLDTVVLHRVSHTEDAVLHHELLDLAQTRRSTRVALISGARGAPDDPDRAMGPAALLGLCPDLVERDVYLCGPPGLTAELRTTLTALGLPAVHLHTEDFAL